tara:strand:+ start:760 stop:930 length:171 start_codon:yes stop_codon:yes gene_type:complete
LTGRFLGKVVFVDFIVAITHFSALLISCHEAGKPQRNKGIFILWGFAVEGHYTNKI